ncbi:MAG: CoA ester lyase [Alphaproteobacteria bacterium]|nr:CoA ester lyase [Alphaproteobacteria bacterium]
MYNFSCCRSILFVPGNRPERFQKALDSGADAIVLDLEDSISFDDKDLARNIVVQYFVDNKIQNDKVGIFVRINSIKTPAGLKDVLAIIDSQIKPTALIIPKTESAGGVEILDDLFVLNPQSYILLIETAKGLREVYNSVRASPNTKAINFGGADYSADIGATLSWDAMLNIRSEIVAAASTFGIHAIDVPYLGLNDPDNIPLETETERIKELGFTSKIAIHPKQVASINKVFSPTQAEYLEAESLLSQMVKTHGNVFQYKGKMVGEPIIKKAEKAVAIYKTYNTTKDA